MARMIDPYTVRTYSGNYLSFADPQESDIAIEDIARALSRAPRFGGHTREAYFVAQHAIMASLYVRNYLEGTPLQQLQALHHDDSEAYISDMPTPAKRMMPDYYAVELKLQNKINSKFGLPVGSQEEQLVKRADVAMLFLERDALLDDTVTWSNEDEHPRGTMLTHFPWWKPYTSDEAMDHFLHRHDQLNMECASFLKAA